MLKRLLVCLLPAAIASVAWAGPLTKTPPPTAANYDPLDHWEFALESGALWRVGGNGSQLDYVILPQILTFKSPTAFHLAKIAGGDFVMRNRFSIPRYMAWEQVSISLGLMYQHISNQGLDDINPGIDALGPVLGVTWHF
jgi:hypothetical protein